METETILLRKIVKFWNQQDWSNRPDGELLLTNRCLLFRSPAYCLSFPLTELKNLRTRRVMLISPALQFEFAGRTYVFTFLWNAEAVLQAVAAAQQRCPSSAQRQQPGEMFFPDDH